jgi:hypothetical protein
LVKESFINYNSRIYLKRQMFILLSHMSRPSLLMINLLETISVLCILTLTTPYTPPTVTELMIRVIIYPPLWFHSPVKWII